MNDLPTILSRPLADPGTPAGDLLAGVPAIRALLAPTGLSREAPRRRSPLPVDAFGCSGPPARERLERILEGEGRFVTTGHQPILFLGPLYVLYKLLTAIEVARRCEDAGADPVLALFWIASDDHDWQEVGATALIDTENRIRHLRLTPPTGWSERSAGPAPLPASVHELIVEIDQILPPTDFKEAYLKLFQDTYAPERPLSEAFALTLKKLLPKAPFAWLDAAHPAVKAAAVPLLSRAIDEAPSFEGALAEGGERLKAEGYEAPLPPDRDATLVFFDTGTARRRLRWENGHLRAGEDRMRAEVVRRMLDESPERFSPNVALRPVLESWLLPVEVAALGPGEIAYWAQLGPLFAAADVPFPAVVPRLSWLLVEGKIQRVLDKLGAAPDDLADGGEALMRRVTDSEIPVEVQESLREARSKVEAAMERVRQVVEVHMPGVRSAAGKAQKKTVAALEDLERQISARAQQQGAATRKQIRKAALHLFPERRPQERVLNPLYYLVRYGPELLREWQERVERECPPLWPPPREGTARNSVAGGRGGG